MAILRQASRPSTSSPGSLVSAYPSSWAIFKASSKPIFSRTILVSMKLVVPFTMPSTSVMTLAARHWCIGVMIGVPPPTEASNRNAQL